MHRKGKRVKPADVNEEQHWEKPIKRKRWLIYYIWLGYKKEQLYSSLHTPLGSNNCRLRSTELVASFSTLSWWVQFTEYVQYYSFGVEKTDSVFK